MPAAEPANRRVYRRANHHAAGEIARKAIGPRPWPLSIVKSAILKNWSRPWPNREARKHAILESSLDPIITINHEGIITEFNRAAEQTFGYPREKIIGTKPSDVLFPPSMGVGEQERIERYLNAGEGSLLGQAGGSDGGPGKRRKFSRRNGHDHQPGTQRPGDELLFPRHQRPEKGRSRAGALCGRTGTLEQRTGAVRLRGLARLAGTAAENSHLQRSPAA